ncbi:MAG TPA: cyclic nucleotide-binding and patatin-like phospholipase domain-containing protein [Candidatus Dormibacteraeota bacterium]|nr:cyclic nucleotide-binding and patatin-like phospholipase domain-containing protein [Candidatus Dormibacteraeota bacterium]
MQLAAMRAVPFFRDLPLATLEGLAGCLRPVRRAAGAVLFHGGEAGDTMYFVQSGRLEALHDLDGEPLALLGPGSFAGEIALLLDQPRSATVRVAEAAELWELSRRDLESLLSRHPLIGVELSRELSRRLVAANRRVAPASVPQCIAVHGDAVELARTLDESEPGRVAVVVLPGAAAPGVLPESVLAVDATGAGPTGPSAYAVSGVPGRGRLLMLLPRAPSELTATVLALSEFAVSVGSGAVPDWLVDGGRRARVLRCDGSAAALRRVSRWVRGCATGLVLSSGGSKAVAHIGVLRVLREMGVVIDAVAGTSGGAVAAAGFASGLDETQMLERLQVLARSFQLRRFDFNLVPRTALSKGIRVRHLLDTFFGGRSFADTDIPLWLVASDVATGQEVVIDSGPLADGVRASMSMPVFFNPWPRGGRLLIDGAVVNPLPASVLRDAGIRRIIASNVAGQDIRVEPGPSGRVPNVLQIVARMMNSMEREMLKTQVPLVDIMIRPRVNTGYSLDFGRMREFIDEGARAARTEAGEALAALAS